MVLPSTLSPALQSHTHLLSYPFTSKGDFYFTNIPDMSSSLPMNQVLISCLDHYNKLVVTAIFPPNMIIYESEAALIQKLPWALICPQDKVQCPQRGLCNLPQSGLHRLFQVPIPYRSSGYT